MIMANNNVVLADHDETVTIRRRAIYHGLCSLLPKQYALAAVKVWQTEFSDKPVYALQPYITRLSDEFNVEAPRNLIQRTLINALSTDVSQLPEDPLSREDIEKPYLIASADTVSVFSSLLSSFLRIADIHDQTVALNIRNELNQGIRELHIPSRYFDQLASMLLEPEKNTLIEGLTIEQMKEILHLVYVQLCRYSGPVTTDRMLSEAVKITEKMPEASNFSPRSFL